MKKVLVLKGLSKYNVLRRATDKIIEGFLSRGYEVKLLDFTQQRLNAFYEELENPYSFIFSCSGIEFDAVLEDGTPLLAHIPYPYIGWFFDDPVYHMQRIRNAVYGNSYCFVMDKELGRTVQKMLPEVKNVYCLFHGGFERKEEVEKNIGVLFPANLDERPKLERYLNNIAPIEQFLAKGTLDILKKHPYLSVRRALEMVLKNVGEELTRELLLELEQHIMFLDLYIRWECRYNILKTLLEHQITVDVIGDGYEELEKEYGDYLVFHGGKDIDDVVDLMARSQIVMNPVPTLREGLHERLLTSMLCKAVCFTPWSEFLEENFGERFGYIHLDNLDEMAWRIKDILEHPEEIQAQVEDNYCYAMEHHTWQKRGEEMIDFYETQIAPE